MNIHLDEQLIRKNVSKIKVNFDSIFKTFKYELLKTGLFDESEVKELYKKLFHEGNLGHYIKIDEFIYLNVSGLLKYCGYEKKEK